MSHPQRVEYLLSQMERGVEVPTLCQQYGVSSSTLYYWQSRYKTYYTYNNRSSAPHHPHHKLTDEVKAAVLKKHKQYPRLGCWRLSLFEYEGLKLGPTSIWQIMCEARSPKLPPNIRYVLTHPF